MAGVRRAEHARRVLREAVLRVEGRGNQLRSKVNNGHGDRCVQRPYRCLSESGRIQTRLFHISLYTHQLVEGFLKSDAQRVPMARPSNNDNQRCNAEYKQRLDLST